jgi:syndetin
MDDVTDSLASAWKEAMKGMKSGYKKTKAAFKKIPMDRLKAISSGGGAMSQGDIRRFFQMKYGAEVRNAEGERVAAGEGSDVESSDEEPLTDAQVQEKVDKKFFDKTYNPVKFELEHMDGFAYTDDEAESRAMREAAESKMLELRQKCNIVSTTLKRRVLAHHHSFVSGTEKIRDVNDSLLMTSSDCKKARAAIRKSKAVVASQITLLGQQRTKENVEATIALLEAMKSVCAKRTQLTNLISSGKVYEAAMFLKREGSVNMEASLAGIYCMRPVLAEWRLYRDNPAKLTDCIEVVLTDCLTNKFIVSTYRNVLEASQDLGKAAETCGLVASLLWKAAIQIMCKSLMDVSFVKREDAPLADIAEGIHPDHLILGVRQMAAKLMDFLYLFSTVVRLHEEERYTGSPYAALHNQALQRVQGVGHKIGRDLIEKVTVVLSNARLSSLDPDRVLHLFVVTSMLTEAIASLGLDKAEQAAARTQTKAALLRHLQANFQSPKGNEILAFMSDDDWTVSAVTPPSLNMVKPLSPESFKSAIKEVKYYLHQSSDDGSLAAGAVPFMENPFLTQKMLEPADTSSLVQTQTFGAYWANAKKGCDSAATNGTELSSPVGNVTPGAAEPPASDPSSSTSDGAITTLAASVDMPPTVMTSSGIAVANAFLEYQARLAVRFPPLAADILGWCEDLLCLYFYTVVDSFVSVSRTVAIENQGDFSPSTQRMLAEVRTAAERCVNAANGQYVPRNVRGRVTTAASAAPSATRFPPHVWGHLRNEFTNPAAQFAVGNRAVACQSVLTLVFLYEAMVQTMSPLLPSTIVQSYMQRCRALYNTAHEVLHVCIHRLCQAIFPMENTCNEIAKLKSGKDEVVVNAYVAPLVRDLKAMNERRVPMPTPVLESLFLQRLVFAVQATLVREYSKLSKKRMSDMFVMQLQVDVQAFQQQVAIAFGKPSVILPDYVLRLVKAGFFASDRGQCTQWVRMNHTLYYSVDLVSWLGAADKPFKLQLEDLLGRELKHQDALPTDRFAV